MLGTQLESDFQSFVNVVEQEDHSEDFSGCYWSDGSPEILFPSWLNSFEETNIVNDFYKDVYSPDCCDPVTPKILVLTLVLIM